MFHCSTIPQITLITLQQRAHCSTIQLHKMQLNKVKVDATVFTNKHFNYHQCNTALILGTCESAVCVRIESRIESDVKIRESNLRIESFQLQRILITKISNYKCSKKKCGTIYSSLKSSNTLNCRRMMTHGVSESVYCTTKCR